MVEVIDGDTVVLDDGKEVRLVGIQAPKLPLNRPNFKEWPLAREAKDELEKLVLNQRVTLSYGGARMTGTDVRSPICIPMTAHGHRGRC